MLKTPKRNTGKGVEGKKRQNKAAPKGTKTKDQNPDPKLQSTETDRKQEKMNETTEKKQRSSTFIIIIPRRGKPSPKTTSKLGHGARDPSRAVTTGPGGTDRGRGRLTVGTVTS